MIRELLQNAKGPTPEVDRAIAWALRQFIDNGQIYYPYSTDQNYYPYSTNYTFVVNLIESQGYDWIMANVNGQVGGTPYACVGVPEDKASYAATPLLSLWLSYFRAKLGDERETDGSL